MHESQSYPSNRFVTLTYRQEDLPRGRSLEYSDFQAFMARMRRDLPGVQSEERKVRRKTKDGYKLVSKRINPIRFFVAGEYGGQTKRPHFHAVLFNTRFRDEKRLHNGDFRSADCEKYWQKGHAVVSELTPARAAYAAGYVTQKAASKGEREVGVDLATGEVLVARREFCQMSRRRGIGRSWYEKYSGDLFPHDFAVLAGKRHRVPRYYWNLAREELDAGLVEELQTARWRRAMEQRGESSPERREVREAVAVAKQEARQRGL